MAHHILHNVEKKVNKTRHCIGRGIGDLAFPMRKKSYKETRKWKKEKKINNIY